MILHSVPRGKKESCVFSCEVSDPIPLVGEPSDPRASASSPTVGQRTSSDALSAVGLVCVVAGEIDAVSRDR